MNIKLSYLINYLDFKKIAQAISINTTALPSNKTKSSSGLSKLFGNSFNTPRNAISSSGLRPPNTDRQPLHNIPESRDINMPKDTGSMSRFKNTQSHLSHLKDNTILSKPKALKPANVIFRSVV